MRVVLRENDKRSGKCEIVIREVWGMVRLRKVLET